MPIGVGIENTSNEGIHFSKIWYTCKIKAKGVTFIFLFFQGKWGKVSIKGGLEGYHEGQEVVSLDLVCQKMELFYYSSQCH